MTIRSELLARVPGVEHGFGDFLVPLPLSSDWEARRVQWRQVHGVGVAEILASGQACGEVDALYSRVAGVPVAVVTADCVPVLLARRDGSAVAAVHAGWRGTRARILREVWRRVSSASAGGGLGSALGSGLGAGSGERASDWVAAIGPAIGPCCYEVSEELARDFAAEFSDFEGVVPSYRHLDLPGVNASELRAIGFFEVEILRFCTHCAVGPTGEPLFHSYRREGGGTRQYSMIQRVR